MLQRPTARWTILIFSAMAQPALADSIYPIISLPAEEVIVVRGDATWRSAAPISGSVLGPDTIDRLGISGLDGVALAVPGLSMIRDQDPGTNIVTMRGVSTDRLQQAAIAFVIDGVPLADTELFTGPLFDLERIDVLRGPQGGLFGKSAAGGAVEVSTLAPIRSDNASFVAAAVGDGGLREASGAATADLGAQWRMRAAWRWSAADGWIKNRTLHRIVDAEESRSLRLRAIGPALGGEIDATLFAMEEDGGAAWASSNNVIGRFSGKLSGAALSDPIGDYEGRSYRKWGQAAVRYVVEPVSDLRITALAARDVYRKRWDEELDYRAGPLTFFGAPLFADGLQPIRQPTDIDATTIEARVNWIFARAENGGYSSVKAGVFAQDIDRDRIDDFGPLLFGANPAAYEGDALQKAAYVHMVHDQSDWRVEGSMRVDSDERRQIIRDALTGQKRDARRARFTQWQPRLAGSVRVADDGWLFGAYGEGFRSGGFNPAPGATSVWRAKFEPETTRSLEIGWRTRGELQIEAVAFAAAIENYQNYTFLDGNSVTLNVARVDVRGGELSIARNDMETIGGFLDVGFVLAIADSKIASYIAPDPLIAGAVRDYSGKRVPNAPLWSAAAQADWSSAISADATWGFGATLNAAGETFFEIDNWLRSPTRAWLDLRASLSLGEIKAALIARNVSDERWAISAFGQNMLPLLAGLGPDGPFDTFTLNRGRQVRLELTRSF